MQATRRELVDDVLDFVGEINDPTARDTANRTLNRVLEKIWLRHPWRQFWMPSPYTFLTVAGQRAYPLPEYFGRIGSQHGRIRNLSTGSLIDPIQPEQLETAYPDAGSPLEVSGAPSVFTIGGTVGVDVQPAATDTVTVVSASVADTDIVVSLEGLDATGRWTRTQVTLAGTTPVDCGSWSKIVGFGKSYVSTTTPVTSLTSSRGVVTLSAVGIATLQSLQPYEAAVEHQELILYPAPSASGHTIAVPTLRTVRRCLYDGDVIPAHWGPAVVEEMLIQWRVFNGEIGTDAEADRPAFRDLIAFDNTGRLTVPERKRGWSG